MHRRHFLAFASALLLPPFAAAARRQQTAMQPAPILLTQLRTELLQYTRSLVTDHTIGSAWLAAGSARPSPEQLLDSLSVKLGATRSSTALAAQSDMRELVALQIRRDFQAGNIVTLNGWMLAHTETELCGLACLLDEHATLS